MNTATIQEIKKELRSHDADSLQELCVRLAKSKNENKELLSYLLFEAHNEQAYVENVKEEIHELFERIPPANVYYLKKSVRKILRIANKQIKYTGIKQSELEIRIFFCRKMKESKIPLQASTVLFNLYEQQLKKIENALAKLPEDRQGDYERELKFISY